MEGGSGPRKALIQISEEGQIPIPFTTSIELAAALNHVLNIRKKAISLRLRLRVVKS